MAKSKKALNASKVLMGLGGVVGSLFAANKTALFLGEKILSPMIEGTISMVTGSGMINASVAASFGTLATAFVLGTSSILAACFVGYKATKAAFNVADNIHSLNNGSEMQHKNAITVGVAQGLKSTLGAVKNLSPSFGKVARVAANDDVAKNIKKLSL